MSNGRLPLALLGLAACSTPGPEVNPDRVARTITSAEGDLGDVVSGNAKLAWDIYGELSTGSENLFYSPFSMSAALGMTMAGADGDTLTEMSQVLGVGVPEADWHSAMGDVIRDLNGDFDRGYTLHVANRLWGQDGYPFEQDFLDVCADDYDAPFEPWDFRADPDGGRQRVNQWVLEQTEERIEDLLPGGSVTVDTRLVLANAIYFLGDWAFPFDPEDTQDGAFTRIDGSTVTAPIMSLDTENYEEPELSVGFVDGATVVRLPYQDDEVSMLLVVPDAPDGLPALEAQLDAPTFDGWVDTLQQGRFMLQMPKFELEYEVDLVPVLATLGMSDAFDGAAANFERMAMEQPDGRLHITGVFHKAFVKVDEEGTEAAAATGVVLGVESAPPFVDATHPFLFVLRDDLTGSILFVGRVMDPTAG
ncbi:MAG: serpin family protein [Myxococcota bacterium]